MEGAPLVFAAGAAPPLDLSLDEIIKQRKKDDKKAKPGAAKATPGKKGQPQAAGKKAVVQGMAVKGQAKRQAVLAKKRGMNDGAVAMAVDRARKAGGQSLKKIAKVGVPIGRKGGKPGVLLKGKKKGGLKAVGSIQSVQSQPGSGLKFAAGTLKVSIANTNAAAKPQQQNGGARQRPGGNMGRGKGRGGLQKPSQSQGRAAAGADRQKQARAAQLAQRRGIASPAAGGGRGGKQGRGGKAGGRGAGRGAGRGGERVTIGGARF